MYKLLKLLVLLIKKSKNLSALSCKLVKLTGKSKYPIHPKHLINKTPWFLKDIKKSDKVLDLGCGNGQHSLKIASNCHSIIAIDNNLEQLKIAKKSAKDKGIKNVEFKELDLETKLPFKDCSFNVVLALDILEHLNNRSLFLREIKRVLKSEGLLILTVPNKNTSWKKIQRKFGIQYFSDRDHKTEYALKQINRTLKKAGFDIVKISPIAYDTPFIGFIDIIGSFSLAIYKMLLKWKKNKVINNLNESIGFRIIIKN